MGIATLASNRRYSITQSLVYALWLSCFAIVNQTIASDLKFRVGCDVEPKATSVGRLIVLLIDLKSERLRNRSPIDGPFWTDPQPLFGTDVSLVRGQSVIVDDSADGFPRTLSQLPAGRYRAQARWDGQRLNSDWRREPGNLWSDVVEFEWNPQGEQHVVDLVLRHSTNTEPNRKRDGVDWLSVPSKLLSQFRGQSVMLNAGIVFPTEFDAKRKYPVIYEVPGFGGDHRSIPGTARRAASSHQAELARNAFHVYLDPEGPNGHTLFANSENNGPCGDALVQELIPALEAKFPMIASREARLLRGHSSGGWSTLWLVLQYPETFGAAWSSAPDPVCFHRFQKVDIYTQPNFYVDDKGADLPSLRTRGRVEMTIRQESRGEDILGPDNTSAQQWDSWFAVFGPKDASGNPAALFDPKTGVIDRKVSEFYRRFDLCELLRREPTKYLPIFKNRIRLLCGTEDSFYLNEAVALLDSEIQKLGRGPMDTGYIKLIPGDHGSIMSAPEGKAIASEMLEHLRSLKLIP